MATADLVQEWMKTSFDFPKYEMTLKDKKQIKFFGIAQWIYERLIKGEFRRSAVKEDTKADILKKVKLSVEKNEPIYLIVAFGGYKSFWNQSYPEIDFAELFNLRFMARFVAPIAAAYAPGVIIDYESEDVALPLQDNYPPSALDSYNESFRKLINTYSAGFPNNLKINLVRAQTQYDEKKLKKRISELMPEIRKRWEGMPADEKEERLHRVAKNIMWKGQEDWSGLSEKERAEKIKESKMVNEAFYAADWEFREKYFVGDTHIPITLTFGLTRDNVGNWLMLGSTKSSFVDFWVGRGILEINGEKVSERIVSHEQYEAVKDKLATFDALAKSDLKNLRKIEVGENISVYQTPREGEHRKW